MTMTEYINSRGLNVRLVSQEMKVSCQAVAKYTGKIMPRADTMKRIAIAMTNLGVPTTAVDIFSALTAKSVEKQVEENNTAEG